MRDVAKQKGYAEERRRTPWRYGGPSLTILLGILLCSGCATNESVMIRETTDYRIYKVRGMVGLNRGRCSYCNTYSSGSSTCPGCGKHLVNAAHIEEGLQVRMRTTDPAELARLAREDKDGLVRAKAVQLLAKDWTSRSQQLFAEVAQDDQDGSVRWEAVKGLYDVDILAKIAKKGDADRRVIQCAVGGLFANVTHCYLPLPREGSVRTAAGYETKKVAWVSSLNILADVAKNGQCCEASRDALERLKECADSMDSSGTNFRAILADIAQTASDKAIRSRAVYLMDSVK